MPEPPLHLPGPVAAAAATSLPLQGLTLLAVEDSRLASDALRLMCQHSGARLRRAESLAMARAHLGYYRPALVMVDLGLPDGDGTSLIRDLRDAPERPPILALSGDPTRRQDALLAGADAFQEKPIPGLLAFQALILRLINGAGPGELPPEHDSPPLPSPDLMALRDDLSYAASMLLGQRNSARLHYVAGFLAGVARSAQDDELARAAQAVLRHGDACRADLATIIGRRLAQPLAHSLVPLGQARPPQPGRHSP